MRSIGNIIYEVARSRKLRKHHKIHKIIHRHAKALGKKSLRLIRGFTLIELIVITSVLGVVAAVAIAIINPSDKINSAKDAGLKSDIKGIGSALRFYYIANNSFPDAANLATGLVNTGELKVFPDNPFGTTATCQSTEGQGAANVNGFCYNTSLPGDIPYGVVVYAPLKSNADKSNCPDGNAWFTWSLLANSAGIACTASPTTEPSVTLSDFSVVSPTDTPAPLPTDTPTPIPPTDTPTPTAVPPTPTNTPFPTATPTPTPSSPQKRVFIASAPTTGAISGAAGADSKCQTAANNAVLGGTWKAWFSDGSSAASTRLAHSTDPYKLLNGTIIADNWTDLTDGTIQNPINYSEINTTISGSVWTNTAVNGAILISGSTTTNCTNFTSGAGSRTARIGTSSSTAAGWTNTGGTSACSASLYLYCLEQ